MKEAFLGLGITAKSRYALFLAINFEPQLTTVLLLICYTVVLVESDMSVSDIIVLECKTW